MQTHDIDPTRVYVTGHSMGGHGAWQFGVLYPGRFQVIGPSAGWISFATYGGDPFPEETSPFYWARRSSDTTRYLENMAKRAIYIIHGDADDNVPISQAYTMYDLLRPIAPDLAFHVQPGAGHWWNGDNAPGADCVDWSPLFATMSDRRLDPLELDFSFRSAGPWVNPSHSYVTIQSALTPADDVQLTSETRDDALFLTTENARSFTIDGAGLIAKGYQSITIDETARDLEDGDMWLGPQTGKRIGVHGPSTAVFFAPFCFVYDPDGPEMFRRYADYLTTAWTIIGNGHACTLPFDQLTAEIRADRNLIYLGLSPEEIGFPASLATAWRSDAVEVGGNTYSGPTAMIASFPDGDRLGVAVWATAGHERLLFGILPWTSRFVIPDYLVWGDNGLRAGGFYTSDWGFDPTLGLFGS
jgi:hypothetical protein